MTRTQYRRRCADLGLKPLGDAPHTPIPGPRVHHTPTGEPADKYDTTDDYPEGWAWPVLRGLLGALSVAIAVGAGLYVGNLLRWW